MRYVICYDTLYVFPNKVDANRFFTECYYMSEGAEQNRYAAILMGLASNSKIALDHSSDYCREITIPSKDDKEDFMTIKLNNYLSFNDAVNYYEKTILPILNISEQYKIHFRNRLPFEDFGSDKECVCGSMYSLSNYYKDILEKFDLNIDKIITENKFDGKYKITINDSYVFEAKASDDLDIVFKNVNNIKEELKQKELNYE